MTSGLTDCLITLNKITDGSVLYAETTHISTHGDIKITHSVNIYADLTKYGYTSVPYGIVNTNVKVIQEVLEDLIENIKNFKDGR